MKKKDCNNNQQKCEHLACSWEKCESNADYKVKYKNVLTGDEVIENICDRHYFQYQHKRKVSSLEILLTSKREK